MIRFPLSLGVLGTALSLAGCPAQVDTDYLGEALLTVSGKVSASTVELDAPVEPVLAWYDFDGDESPSLFQRTQVTGEFPNKFTMRAHSPPPDRAIIENDAGERVAMARIFALRSDVEWNDRFTEEDETLPPWLLGAAENYFVLYMDTPTAPGGEGEKLLGQPVGRGYHLLRVDFPSEAMKAEYHACVEGVSGRALERFNQAHGTDYADSADIPEPQQDEFSDLENEEWEDCPFEKAHFTLVPSGTEHPIALEIGTDLNLPDWH